MSLASKNSRKPKKAFPSEISTEAFVLVFVASFSIGFIVSLITWLFTVDYIFVVLK